MKKHLIACALLFLLVACSPQQTPSVSFSPPSARPVARQTPPANVPRPKPAARKSQPAPPAKTVAPSLPRGWCYVDTVVPGIAVDLKYAGSDNFVGRPIAGYTGRRAILRRDAAEALGRAAAELKKEGLGLLIWDAYRPTGATQDFYRWSFNADERMRARFYPNISKRGIYEGRYLGRKSEHNWGVAVDLTLVQLSSGAELDMGGHHDLLDPSSATAYTGITPQQQANRRHLCEVMARAGFRNYRKEWWHYYLPNSQPWHAHSFPLNDNLPEYGKP